jgi:CBS domain containing-hemolysin-like protein
MIFFILTVGIALAISAMCSLLEACLLSLSVTDIAKMASHKPAAAALWKSFKENIQRPIAVILIINTFSQTIGAALSGSQFNQLFGAKWIALYSVAFSLFMIQWSEILPKTYGIQYNRTLAPIVARPLQFMIRVLSPLVLLIQWMNKPFQGKKKVHADVDALNDISVLVHFASLHNLISKEQEKIVSRSIELSKRRVEDIMVGRDEIRFLSTSMSLVDALIEAHKHHHTRFPLIEGNDMNQVIGYVNFKDIVSALQLNPKNPSLKGISRPILMVKSNENLTAVLNRLTKSYQHIALVRDPAGTFTGLVTLEDIVEAIVGDISDEYDILPEVCYSIAENRWVVGGGVRLSKLAEELCVPAVEPDMTLNEWMLSKLDRLPKAEDRVTEGGCTFIVHKVSRSQIHEVICEKS